jgi:hypothetical protein
MTDRQDIVRTSFAMVPGWVITRVTNPTALRYYLHIAWRYANEKRYAFPSEAQLAEDLGDQLRTAQRAIKALRDADALIVTRSRRADGNYAGNRYWLPMDDPREHATNMAGGPDLQERTTSSVSAGHHQPPNMAAHHATNMAGQEPDPQNQPHNPLISSNEEIISPRARAHTRVGAPARETTNPGPDDGQCPLDGMPGPASSGPVVPIHRKAEETFTRFWAVYPLKKAKGDAWKAWPKAIKAADPEVIIAGVARYIAELRATGAYTAYPATWLNGRRWEDEPAKAGNAGRSGGDKRGSGDRYQRHFEHIPDEAYAGSII